MVRNMTKKQKKMLSRILIAVALLILFSLLPLEGALRFGLFMVPYFVVGYDILRKALKGVWNRQVFDESFLMTVATVGAIALGDYAEAWRSCCFTRLANCSRAMPWVKAAETSPR